MFGFRKKIDIKTIQDEINNGSALLVDVRSNDEWNNGHAIGALHFSSDAIFDGKTPTHDSTKKLYIYCASGGRAGLATKILAQKGFQTENIGGLADWQSAGGEIE